VGTSGMEMDPGVSEMMAGRYSLFGRENLAERGRSARIWSSTRGST
jgi:hypothetical protein